MTMVHGTFSTHASTAKNAIAQVREHLVDIGVTHYKFTSIRVSDSDHEVDFLEFTIDWMAGSAEYLFYP